MTTKKRCFFAEIDAPDLNDFAVKRQETSTGFLLAFFPADWDYEPLVDWNNMHLVGVNMIATVSDSGMNAWSRTTLGTGNENVMERVPSSRGYGVWGVMDGSPFSASCSKYLQVVDVHGPDVDLGHVLYLLVVADGID